jgi:hypothetical protein
LLAGVLGLTATLAAQARVDSELLLAHRAVIHLLKVCFFQQLAQITL